MNKTTTINLSGQLFHIDIDAYELLKQYLERVRVALKSDEDRDEIMQDFEQAVAEHLLGSLNDKTAVVTIKLVKKVTATIGEYETENGDEATTEQEKPKTNSWHRHFKNPIYLDRDNALIGGVCAGIARSLEIDAFWLRLAFILIVFSSWGVGILAYIVLMLVMKDPQNMSEKLRAEGIRPTADALVAHSKQRFDQARQNISSADIRKRLHPLTALLLGVIRGALATVLILAVCLITVGYAVGIYQWFGHRNTLHAPQFISTPLSYSLFATSYFVIMLPLLILLLVTISRRIARTPVSARSARPILFIFIPWVIALSLFVGSMSLAIPRLVDWSRQHPTNPYFQLEVKNGHVENFCLTVNGSCNNRPCIYQASGKDGIIMLEDSNGHKDCAAVVPNVPLSPAEAQPQPPLPAQPY